MTDPNDNSKANQTRDRLSRLRQQATPNLSVPQFTETNRDPVARNGYQTRPDEATSNQVQPSNDVRRKARSQQRPQSDRMDHASGNQTSSRKWREQLGLLFHPKRSLPYVIMSLSLLFSWWFLPLTYAKALTEQLNWAITPIFLFSLMMSIALGLMITGSKNLINFISWPFLVVAGLLTTTSLVKSRLEIFILLLMFVGFLLLIQFKILGFQSIFGLIILTVLSSTAIPVTIFYLQADFLTYRFMEALLPLMASFLYFFLPIILPKLRQPLINLGILLLFLITVLLQQTNTANLIILMIIGLITLINQFIKLKFKNWQYAVYLLFQAISVFLIYS